MGIISASGWLFTKKSLTMHVNMHVKFTAVRFAVTSVRSREDTLFGCLETENTSTTTSLRNLGNFVLLDKAKHLRILESSVTQP